MAKWISRSKDLRSSSTTTTLRADQPDSQKGLLVHRTRRFSVGLPRFELGTFGPPDRRANQAAPQPVWTAHSTGGLEPPARVR